MQTGQTGAGIRPARQERSRITQRKILDAARSALRESGWDGLVITRVASSAGVSVGAVYDRFNDKAGLVRAVQQDVLDAVDRDLRDGFERLAAQPSGSASSLLADALRVLLSQTLQHGPVMGPLVLRAAVDPSLHVRGDASRSLAERLFVDLITARAHLFDRPPPTVAVQVAFRAVFSHVMWNVTFGENQESEQLSDEVLLREWTVLCQAYLLHRPG